MYSKTSTVKGAIEVRKKKERALFGQTREEITKGMSKKEAKKELIGLNIEFVGNGEKVIDIQPNINSRVKENSTVKILLK